jgi:hypothetical protein
VVVSVVSSYAGADTQVCCCFCGDWRFVYSFEYGLAGQDWGGLETGFGENYWDNAGRRDGVRVIPFWFTRPFQ